MKQTCYSIVIAVWTVLVPNVGTAGEQLVLRTPTRKPATITKPPVESALTIKFRDDLKVRAANGDVTSSVGSDLGNVLAVRTQFGLTFSPLIDLPQTTLDYIEARAEQRTGLAQPDLAGMMVVRGADATIEAAGQALLVLDEIEWACFSAIPVEPPCEDVIPDITPDYFASRDSACGDPPDICDYHGPDPGLDMTCAWEYGARGQGIQIADAEFAYIRDHEDLCSCTCTIGDPPPAGCNVCEHLDQEFNNDEVPENHGAADSWPGSTDHLN